MKKENFNSGWYCKCLQKEEASYPVPIPHDAMMGEKRTEKSFGEGNIGWFECNDYEYSKKFQVPQEYEGKKIVLEFEGVYRNAEVFLGDKKIAYRPYGYTNFYVDLTEEVTYNSENEIRVIAHNSDQPNSRWYTGTGIYRPVHLYIGGEMHICINGVRIRTVSYNPAIIGIEMNISMSGEVALEISDNKETLISRTLSVEGTQGYLEVELPEANLWSCEEPQLYTCRITFGNDVVEEQFGIRLAKWNSRNGLTINGKKVILRGACIHHDNGVLGACAYEEAEERKVRILKENGYNALRSSHNPCSKAMLDACDRLGMLMVDEYVDVWYIHKTENDYASYMEKWWEQDLKDMVEKDYNHPSVIMYSTGNEVAETAQKKGIGLVRQMTDYLHELDDTRPVTCGINIFFNFLSSIGLGIYSDKKAEKQAARAVVEKKKPVGSEFYNTLACLLGDYTMKIGATLYPCDLKTRDAFANMDIAGYNYGIFRYKHDLKKYADRLILGTETFCKDAYSFWELAKKHNRILGDFVWSGMGYIGETGDGAVEYQDYKSDEEADRITGGNGRVDLLGKPGAEASYTKVAFELEKGPYIAVLPVYEKEKLHLTGWQLTKALESWSWRGCSGMPATVEVYARAAKVELFVNGKSVGIRKLKNTCRTVFHTKYEDGGITAVSYNNTGDKIKEQTLYTADSDTVLQVMPETPTVKAGGLAFVWLRYTDKNGVWKPMERHNLRVSVKNGSLLGLGSANPYMKGNYKQDVTSTYFGEALAVILADGDENIEIAVRDEENLYSMVIPCSKR